MADSHYSGHVAGLATRHAKDEAIAPVLRDVLGLEVVVLEVDTDSFGTFTGDVPRMETPLNTAIAKARAGMAEGGFSLGLASEGTIGPHPLMPFVTSDVETIAFVDDARGIVISETTLSTDIISVRETVTADTDLASILSQADFPRHGLIVRPQDGHDGPIVKGITDQVALTAAIRESASGSGFAVLESDLRAYFSPSRMRNIGECAAALANRIATLCPDCSGPGWGRIEPARGLPCSACGAYVESAIRADRFGCPGCPAVREVARADQTVEPRWCPCCNP